MTSKKRNQSKSLMGDPVIRWLTIAIVVMIIGGLLTIVFALINGVIDLSGSARTYSQALSSRKGAIAQSRGTVEDYQSHILALVENGNIMQAKTEFESLKQMNFDFERGATLLFIEAGIVNAEGDKKQAAVLYREVVDATRTIYEDQLEHGGEEQNWAIAYGIHPNYGLSLLALARIAQNDGDYAAALEHLEEYAEMYPTQAGIFIDLGNLKLEMGDKTGAYEAFRHAQQWLPDDPEVIQGLEQSGQ